MLISVCGGGAGCQGSKSVVALSIPVLAWFQLLLPQWLPLVRPAVAIGNSRAHLVCKDERSLMTYTWWPVHLVECWLASWSLLSCRDLGEIAVWGYSLGCGRLGIEWISATCLNWLFVLFCWLLSVRDFLLARQFCTNPKSLKKRRRVGNKKSVFILRAQSWKSFVIIIQRLNNIDNVSKIKNWEIVARYK